MKLQRGREGAAKKVGCLRRQKKCVTKQCATNRMECCREFKKKRTDNTLGVHCAKEIRVFKLVFSI